MIAFKRHYEDTKKWAEWQVYLIDISLKTAKFYMVLSL